LILALGVLTFLIFSPFIGYLLGSLILGFVLYPLQKRLRVKTSPRISAGILIVLTMLLIVLPLFFVGTAVIDDAVRLSEDIDDIGFIDVTSFEDFIEQHTGVDVDILETVDQAVRGFAGLLLGNISLIVTVAVEAALGITLMLFVLYYLLKDGEEFVQWLKATTPMPREIQDDLYRRVNKNTWAVIKGHVFVAILQGVVAGIGLAVAGVPNYFFWTFIMILLAFIPIIGTIIVWLPASAYLFLVGEPFWGTFLFLYGLLVVSFTDNIFRPIVVERGADLHPAVILIGVLGGVYIFGATGLFIGPIVIGVFKSTLTVFRNHYKEL